MDIRLQIYNLLALPDFAGASLHTFLESAKTAVSSANSNLLNCQLR